MPRTRIVIVGAGFAGVKCAQVLARAPEDLEVVVFNRDNHMVFQPLLPDVAGSSLNPRAIAPPLRLLLPSAQCRTEEVVDVDFDARLVVHADADGTLHRMPYDEIVLACGSVVDLAGLPGMADHALPLKTIGDAIALRAQVMAQLERAELCADAERRRHHGTFIVVGGGFSGVEVAGEIHDLLRDACRHHARLRADELRVVLLHGQPELLPELSPRLRRDAARRMAKRGIELRLSSRVAEVTRRGVRLADGTRIDGATVVSTVGARSNPILARLGLALERGRVRTTPELRVEGRAHAWAVGDCAHIVNAFDGTTCPPTAQFAERQGHQCARNLLRMLRARPTQPFRHRNLGAACGIGGREGIVEVLGVRLTGRIAWWLWRSAFLIKVPTVAQKLKIGLDWAWELIFPRDLSHFRPTQTDPLARSHYGDGDVIVRADPVPTDLYSVERGQVELVGRCAHSGEWRALATLGPGSVVGRETFAAFVETGLHLRARGEADVWQLGRDALLRLSRALAPVEAIVERAVARPRASLRRHHPGAMAALARVRAVDLPDARPALVLEGDAKLAALATALAQDRAGCAVVTLQGRLAGIVTRTDLVEALAHGAIAQTRAIDIARRDPVHVDDTTSAADAAGLLADAGLKHLPVVDVQGRPLRVLGLDDFLGYVLAQSAPAHAATSAAAPACAVAVGG